MTRILAIEGTRIRIEVETCERCPCYSEEEAPTTEICGLGPDDGDKDGNGIGRVMKLLDEWVLNDDGKGHRRLPYIDPACPLPEKGLDPLPRACAQCGMVRP